MIIFHHCQEVDFGPHTHRWLALQKCLRCYLESTQSNKDKVTRLPVDTIVNEVISSPLVKNLWCNIIQNCDVKISKECQSLCLENVVKLYVTVRCFSLAKDIVNKYKLNQGVQKKSLRKDLKIASETM